MSQPVQHASQLSNSPAVSKALDRQPVSDVSAETSKVVKKLAGARDADVDASQTTSLLQAAGHDNVIPGLDRNFLSSSRKLTEIDAELKKQGTYVPLVLSRHEGGLGYNDATKALLESIGGLPALKEMTLIFYRKFWADVYLRQFLGHLTNPLETHASRIAMYIAEMMGAKGTPWSADCARRPPNQEPIANGDTVVVNSRQRAHFAAWNSVTRPKARVGRRFKLDDCRVWMRLMFWAVRESGLADKSPAFWSFYQRFIGHFIAIYEDSARQFTRQEARWSANADNIARYLEGGNIMTDVVDVPFSRAIRTLPEEEHEDSGLNWPYHDAIRF